MKSNREEHVNPVLLEDQEGNQYPYLASLPLYRRQNVRHARRLLIQALGERKPHKRARLVAQARKLLDQEIGNGEV